VHVAPANVPLQWIQSLSMTIDDERHGLLNSLGINVLRADAGRGLRLLGARTVSADTDWRFTNVRRLMCMIEKAIDVSIQWAVFEPNDWRTRAKLGLVIGSFLQALYERGAMVGATPEQAFFVRCDDGNNPPSVRDRGELRIDVGVAPTSPFEFIVLRVGRDANGFAVHESEPLQSAA
jgi:phage tail sheath protein FI